MSPNKKRGLDSFCSLFFISLSAYQMIWGSEMWGIWFVLVGIALTMPHERYGR